MPFLFLFVPKAAPYVPAVYQIAPESLDQGQEELDEAVEMYKRSTATGAWPGHGMDPIMVELPAWKRRRETKW
jgi:hypothetical protein